MTNLPSKQSRIARLLEEVEKLSPARSGLEAYAQLANVLNAIEDEVFSGYWNLPRTFLDGTITERMYISQPECFEYVEGYPSVTNMVHVKEFIFISPTGAIEIQKDTGENEKTIHFSTRKHAILFAKNDSEGHGVWHPKHATEPTSTLLSTLQKISTKPKHEP